MNRPLPTDIYLLEEMNATQVKDKITEKTVAILVLGACENHGNHMSFGSDFIFPMKLIKIILDEISNNKNNLILLPAVPYGVSSHHNNFQMTMSLEPSTMISIIENIFCSLVKNGVRKILVINGHDGNIAPIEIASRKVKNETKDLVIACLESWWVLVGQKNKGLFEVWSGLGHGGEAETSAMLAVRPDLVNTNYASEQVIPNLPEEEIRLYWKFNELTNTGSTGAPKKASVEKGQKIIEILKGIIISFISNMEKNDWKYGISQIRID
ncbi:MAG: creatininase family protein [Thermoproteota archaeon]|nr:creatininase family protein [Thermoproteota archaeon]